MKKNEQNIDDFFKSELGNYTEAPPPAAWGALEKKLDGAVKPGFFSRWYIYAGMASLLVVMGVSISKKIAVAPNAAPTKIAPSMTSPAALSTPTSPVATTSTPNVPAVATPANQTPTENNATGNNDPSTNRQPLNKNQPLTQNNNQNSNQNHKNSKHTPYNTHKQLCGIARQSPVKNNTPVVYGSSPAQQGRNNGAETERTNGLPADNQPNTESQNLKTETPEIPTAAKTATTPPKQADKVAQVKKPAVKPPAKPKIEFNRFEAGIKGGFERGFDNEAAHKAVISPYIQYNITPRLSIMAQPAVKYASFNMGSIGTPKSYYKENNDSIVVAGPTLPGYNTGEGNNLYITDFYYSQSHDSIVKSYTYSGTYMEYELPILLKYYLTKEFSVYGGVNISYSKLTGITENTYNSLIIKDTMQPVISESSQKPIPPSTASELKYTGTPYSNYTGPLYVSPQGGLLRFGYMFGFSYEFTPRWLFDGLVQQGSVKSNTVAGYNTNEPVSAPYFRITLGYKIVK